MLSKSTNGSVKLFFREAIARALREEMLCDPGVIVLGQDVGKFGGTYKEFLGLYEEFGSARVRDTPVAEGLMIGLGVGAAAAGLKPLVNITYMDFLMLGLDPLVNYGAKAKFKTGGQLSIPLVVKTTSGAKGQGVAHSQCIEAWLMGVPGLRIVSPSNPADAYGLLKSALRANCPVIFIDNKRLFPLSGEVPIEETLVEIGKARVLRTGERVSIVTYGYMTHTALEAAECLSKEGIDCEVIDLRSLAPLDIDTVAGSVAKTGVLVTLEEGQVTCGVGAEVAFQVRQKVCTFRGARVGALPAPVSSNTVLEHACIPEKDRLMATIHGLLDCLTT